MQEFLASYSVKIDEAGVSRLNAILQQNRDLAKEVSDAFDAAARSISNYETAITNVPSNEAGSPGTGGTSQKPSIRNVYIKETVEEESSISVPNYIGNSVYGSSNVSLDTSDAEAKLKKFSKDAEKAIPLRGDGSGIVSAAQKALSDIRSLFSSADLQLRVTIASSKTGNTPGGTQGTGGKSNGGLVNSVAAELAASSAGSSSIFTQSASNVQAPVNINVQASGADPVAIGETIYNTAENYLLRTLQGAVNG
ncbi:MAG: hypothetical protein VZR73_06755 [Acutalibacteraceae bacterium]|nr:hypothetical protein [Acutalibacteraceae bacterium]